VAEHRETGRRTGHDLADALSRPDPGLDWHRRLTLAVLTGWHRLPADQLHDLVGTADPGQLATLIDTPGFLAATEPGVLLSALMHREDAAVHRWAHLLTAARLPDATTGPAARRDRVHLASRGFAPPVTAPGAEPVDRVLRPRWTTVPSCPSIPLTGHTAAVRTLAAVTVPDGRTLLATGSADATVRLWDPTTGAQVGEPLTGHTGAVAALATVILPDGRTLLATASRDDTVRVWDPTTGAQVGHPLTGHTDTVTAIATITLPDGRTLLATGSDDHTVRLWDPVAYEPVGVWHLPHPVHAVTGLPGAALALAHGYETAVLTVHPTTQPARP
jgi:hypothetical protein